MKSKSDSKFFKDRNEFYKDELRNVRIVLHVVVEHQLTNSFNLVHKVYNQFKNKD